MKHDIEVVPGLHRSVDQEGQADMTGFAARLRRATMIEHREAETRGFISRLLAGQVPIAGFTQLTAQYLAIYRELEAAADLMRTNEIAAAFADPALSRVPSLKSDLAHLASRAAAPESDLPHLNPKATASEPDLNVTILESTERYVRHLREHCRTSPAHFIAHHYVRYLGDLSGGQLIGRALTERYGLDRAATSFYRFDQIPDPRIYKIAYRQRLDALDLPEPQLAALASEAQLAFTLNAAVFTELGDQFPPGLAQAA
jgi:heme oxygenase (biliverdin-producing, ferredoxin)